MDENLIKQIFGEDFVGAFKATEHLKSSMQKVQYSSMSNAEFVNVYKDDILEGNSTYWTESLERSHFAAIGALLRNERWISGLLLSVKESNIHLFAAALRGLIESVADSSDSLNDIALNLAGFRVVIEAALARRLITVATAPSLEKKLVHFAVARRPKKSEEVSKTHKAKTTWDYLKALGSKHEKTMELYSRLCEITHPAQMSIIVLLDLVQDSGAMKFHDDPDSEYIQAFLESYKDVMPWLLSFAFNPSVLIFRVLNKLPATHLHTPTAEQIDLSKIPAWRRVKRALDNASLPNGYVTVADPAYS